MGTRGAIMALGAIGAIPINRWEHMTHRSHRSNMSQTAIGAIGAIGAIRAIGAIGALVLVTLCMGEIITGDRHTFPHDSMPPSPCPHPHPLHLRPGDHSCLKRNLQPPHLTTRLHPNNQKPLPDPPRTLALVTYFG